MAMIAYKAIDARGEVQTGEMEFENEEAAISKLHSMGMRVVSLSSAKEQKTKQARKQNTSSKAKANLEDLAMVSRQLAIMIDSGVSIIEALEAISLQIKDKSLKDVLDDVRQQVLQGHSFSQALAKHPRVFSELYIDMVKTAEASGELGKVMDQLSAYLEGSLDIIRKVKAASMYPMIIIAASLLTVGGLVFLILPRFTTMFTDMGMELPPTTKALLAISEFCVTYWYIVAILGFLIFSGVKIFAVSPRGRIAFDWMKLHAPLVGDLVRKIVLSRSLLALGTLLQGGVPLITALDTAAGAAGNQIIASVYKFTKSSVETGSGIADAFRTSPEFPPLLIQMTSVGEKTGQLPEILLKVSAFYEQEADVKIKGLTSIVEPVLIVVLGTLIGFIAISIISPIYTLVGNVGK